MSKVLPAILLAVVAASAALPGATLAKTAVPNLNLPDVKILSQQRLIYRCAGDVRLPVRYLNTNAGAFAYLPVAGKRQLFVSVVAASGVKYVAGRYVWWNKGNEGFLSDETLGEDAEPILKDCKQIENW
ncbi:MULTISPECIES: MliC family protein [unclassified Herbaspirillum]|uniref:MliC family protein n=1 Tax=unclassified Herbaspirillum TaxID=2624150 RepID=UPI001313F8AD|nr:MULTISPECIES: MliC family protein [unclassified Herbaspirillum]